MGKVAVVGVGYWGPNLIRNFLGVDGIDGVVACDVSSARLAFAARRFPEIQCTSDFEALLRRPDIDAVAIATATRMHYPMAKAALEAGKHVLVEKPLAMNVDEASSLVEFANARHLTLMVDHTFIYTGAVEKMKEIVDSGELGDVLYVDSVRVNLGLFQSDVNVIWDLAPHDISIVGFLLGRSPKVVRAIAQCHTPRGLEDVAYVHIDYGGNTAATFHVSWLAPTKVRRMMICGARRMIMWNDMDEAEKIRVYDRGVDLVPGTMPPPAPDGTPADHKYRVDYRMGDVLMPHIDRTEALDKMTKHFVACYRARRVPRTSARDGLEIVRVLAATALSLKHGGRAISIENGRPELI